MGLSQAILSTGRPLVRAPDATPRARRHHGHRHFWHRALSRRAVVQSTGGLVLAGLAGRETRAFAQEATIVSPKPIPGGGFDYEGELFHVYDYLPGNEPSTIGDFRGLVAINHLLGEGTVTRGGGGGMSTPTATGDRLVYDADMRIMKGLYVGEDGQEHEGTFGFI